MNAMPDRPCKPVVLVVEDHEEYRRLTVLALGRYLEGAVTVLAAAGMTDALAVLEKQPVDVLVSDVMLDDGGAKELLEQAAPHMEKSAGVVLVSNHGPEALGELLSHPRVRGFTAKSEGLAALAKMIRQVLDAGIPSS